MRITEQPNPETGNKLINIAFLRPEDDQALKTFTICGDFLVWIKPEVAATIFSVRIDKIFEEEKKSVDHTVILDSNNLIKVRNFDAYLDDPSTNDFHISPAPKSTHISQRTSGDMKNYAVREDFLQVTVKDRALILDLNTE